MKQRLPCAVQQFIFLLILLLFFFSVESLELKDGRMMLDLQGFEQLMKEVWAYNQNCVQWYQIQGKRVSKQSKRATTTPIMKETVVISTRHHHQVLLLQDNGLDLEIQGLYVSRAPSEEKTGTARFPRWGDWGTGELGSQYQQPFNYMTFKTGLDLASLVR